MRYALAILTLVVSVAAAAPAALAHNGGGTVYVDGVARSTVQPAPLYLGTGAGSGTFAGPAASSQKPYPFWGGDRN